MNEFMRKRPVTKNDITNLKTSTSARPLDLPLPPQFSFLFVQFSYASFRLLFGKFYPFQGKTTPHLLVSSCKAQLGLFLQSIQKRTN